MRRVLGLFGCVVAAVAAIALVLYVVLGPVIPPSRFRQIKRGMTQAEVQAILGISEITYGGREWIYTRWGSPGWVELYFDAEGNYKSVNDESPIPYLEQPADDGPVGRHASTMPQ